MKFIGNMNKDCYFNLAAEEYLLKNFDEEFFMLWQNDNTIVVGRNQNTLQEINAEYVQENGEMQTKLYFAGIEKEQILELICRGTL